MIKWAGAKALRWTALGLAADNAIVGIWMSGFATAARLAAVISMAALVSACTATPGDPGNAGMAMNSIPLSLPYHHSAAHAPDVRDLNGLKPDDVLSMLGQPDLKRDEPPAEVWQYRAADCVLNLFFYDDAGGYRLAHTESWQRTLSSGTSPAQCRDADAPIKAHYITQSLL
jgi:hypothetical protein